jgi:hypothetical protein
MKYYLHDSNAFNDEKITRLYIQFGYEGLGLFYTCLEKFAQQEKPINTLVLKHQLNIGKRLEKCWLFMEQIGLLSSNNGETFNKQLLNFSESYKIKKEKNAKRILEWREKQDNIKNVTCNESVSNTPKVKESKVNEIEYPENFSEKRKELFKIWFDYKLEQHKFTYKSEKSIKALFKELEAMPDIELEKGIQKSMASGYKGIINNENKTNGSKYN